MSKYSGYNENDTSWDEHHKSNGQMTNREFFTSNGKGGFYEGMEWDEENQEWIPNAVERQRQQKWNQENRCSSCGLLKSVCQGECN